MSKRYYLTLPNNKIPLGIEQRGKKPRFCKQFTKLWELLYNIGESNLSLYSGVETSFPTPVKLTSKLIGKQGLVDPTSIVRIYSFINEDLTGPVTNNGYQLDLYNDAVSYEITWKVKDTIQGFLIGFYRSEGFVDSNTNSFSLICGSRGASLFGKTSGSFISPGVNNLFVASNKNTTIELQIKAIIPDRIVYPEISYDEPYTKYITIRDCQHNKFKIPVYTIFVPTKDSITAIKQPNKYFVQAAKIIKNYLTATGLSLTLLPDELEVSNIRQISNNCVNNGCGPDIISLRGFFQGVLGCARTITNKISNPCYYFDDDNFGIELEAKRGAIPTISYIIENNYRSPYEYRWVTKIEFVETGSSGITFTTYDTVNEQGFPDFGKAEQTKIGYPFGERDMKGQFSINEYARGFLITVYYNITSNTSDQEKISTVTELVYGTVFRNITVTYKDTR